MDRWTFIFAAMLAVTIGFSGLANSSSMEPTASQDKVATNHWPSLTIPKPVTP